MTCKQYLIEFIKLENSITCIIYQLVERVVFSQPVDIECSCVQSTSTMFYYIYSIRGRQLLICLFLLCILLSF